MGNILEETIMDITGTIITVTFATTVLGYSETAPYTVVNDHGTWQERNYPPTRWVSTQGFDPEAHDGPENHLAFRRLFEYIDGGNIENMKIPMTAPVSLRILPGPGPNCESNFTMSFLIPSDIQCDLCAPSPTNSLVYLEDRPEMNFVTKTFTGFAAELDWSIQAAELYMEATSEGLSPSDIPLWTAGYSGPSVIVNRRNEVWLEI